MIPSGIVKQIYQAFKDQYKKDKPIKISFNKTQPDIIEKTGKGMMSKLFFVEPRAKEELKGGNLLNLRRFLNN
jgi:uncharacterized membrane-anchored protein